jgi:chromatin assembly factor 1 subunit B
MLASAGDDGNVLLWIPSDISMTAIGDENSEDKETWRVKHMCRSSTGAEIYDLAWSPDGVFFITGGVDNTARIFNAHTGMCHNNVGLGLTCAKLYRSIDPPDC